MIMQQKYSSNIINIQTECLPRFLEKIKIWNTMFFCQLGETQKFNLVSIGVYAAGQLICFSANRKNEVLPKITSFYLQSLRVILDFDGN